VLLADRVLVLTDGVISLDEEISVPSPRLRGDRQFIALRSRLLAELGVDETAEGAHHIAPAPTDSSLHHFNGVKEGSS
jgi:sulfonate transport system ATP-binding protein